MARHLNYTINPKLVCNKEDEGSKGVLGNGSKVVESLNDQAHQFLPKSAAVNPLIEDNAIVGQDDDLLQILLENR